MNVVDDERGKRLLRMLVQGIELKQIARELRVSTRTVDRILVAVREAYGVQNNCELSYRYGRDSAQSEVNHEQASTITDATGDRGGLSGDPGELERCEVSNELGTTSEEKG